MSGQISCPDDCVRALEFYWSDPDGLAEVCSSDCRCVAAPAMLRRAALLADAAKGGESLRSYLQDVLAPAAQAEGVTFSLRLHSLATLHSYACCFRRNSLDYPSRKCIPVVGICRATYSLLHQNGGRFRC